MIDRLQMQKASLLREAIAQYEFALNVAEGQLDHLELERAVRQLCAEFVDEHGDHERCRELLLEVHELDHHIKSKHQVIARMKHLLDECIGKLGTAEQEASPLSRGKET